MLEHLPHAVGAALRGVGPGLDKLAANSRFGAAPETLALTSPAFAAGGPMPGDCTADGRGLSPPLAWRGVPPGAAEVVVVIEDADSATPAPLVHTLLYGLPGRDGEIAEGALTGPDQGAGGGRLGQNSFMKSAYLPPDPPPGHGPHRYAVQVFALDAPTGLAPGAGRGALLDAMAGHVLARGLLIGTYRRG